MCSRITGSSAVAIELLLMCRCGIGLFPRRLPHGFGSNESFVTDTNSCTLLQQAGLPAFVYRYDHLLSFAQMLPSYGLPKVCLSRVCHASEIPLVDHNHANYSFNDGELKLSGNYPLNGCCALLM